MRTGPPVDRWRPLTNTLFSKCCTMAKKEVNQKATVPKTVGMSIRMFVDAETGGYLYRVAKEATFAENALWNLWRMNDPVTYRDVLRMNQEREATGKWPKLPEYKLANTPDGDSPTKIAGNLCPSLWSFVYDAVANHVRKFYSKQRWEILWGKRRLPLASDLRIRFRERAIRIRRHQWTDKEGRVQDGYAIVCRFIKGVDALVPISTLRMNKWHLAWLEHWANIDAGPCGGTVYRKKVRGKNQWFIALARERQPNEVRRVLDPVADRTCYVYAPPPDSEREAFLLMDIRPTGNGQPWREEIEANDLIRVKLRWQQQNQQMGRNFRQSREVTASRGHGLQRRMESKKPDARKYDARCKNWIENRSRAIVDFAVNARCSVLCVENLVQRDSKTLRLGEFPYYQLLLRIKQKAEESGLKHRTFTDFETLRKHLGVAAKGVTEDEV